MVMFLVPGMRVGVGGRAGFRRGTPTYHHLGALRRSNASEPTVGKYINADNDNFYATKFFFVLGRRPPIQCIKNSTSYYVYQVNDAES